MHAWRSVPDVADTLLRGGESSSVSQDVFQFNDAGKRGLSLELRLRLLLFFKHFHLSATGLASPDDAILQHGTAVFLGFQAELWRSG